MKRLAIAFVLALTALALVVTSAVAALPRPGGLYTGTSDVNDRVKVVAETKHNLSLVRVKDDCDEVTRFHDVHVNDEGRFKAVKMSHGFPIFTIKGKFQTRDSAHGTIERTTCSGKPADYTVTRHD